jgi:hypothetical protein
VAAPPAETIALPLLAELCEREGLFDAAGHSMALGSIPPPPDQPPHGPGHPPPPPPER